MEQHHICEANASYRRKAMHHLTSNRLCDIITVIGGATMKENKLVELSMDFSVDMIGCLCVYTECNDEEPLHP